MCAVLPGDLDRYYVVWSETYDRSVSDQLKVQDDIAGEVAKALQAAMP